MISVSGNLPLILLILFTAMGVRRYFFLQLLVVPHTAFMWEEKIDPCSSSSDNFTITRSFSPYYLAITSSLQICCHFGEEIKAGDHKDIKSNITVDILSKVISQYLKGVSTTPSRVESCMYTV